MQGHHACQAQPPCNLVCRYQERGFPFGYVTAYNGFESGNVEVSICEGKIGSIDVVYVDDSGNPVVGRNEVPKDVVLRSSPFRVRFFLSRLAPVVKRPLGYLPASSSMTFPPTKPQPAVDVHFRGAMGDSLGMVIGIEDAKPQ